MQAECFVVLCFGFPKTASVVSVGNLRRGRPDTHLVTGHRGRDPMPTPSSWYPARSFSSLIPPWPPRNSPEVQAIANHAQCPGQALWGFGGRVPSKDPVPTEIQQAPTLLAPLHPSPLPPRSPCLLPWHCGGRQVSAYEPGKKGRGRPTPPRQAQRVRRWLRMDCW